MPPKRKSPVAAVAPVESPRKTRSMAAGKKPDAEAPAKSAKKKEAAAVPVAPAAAEEKKGRRKAKKEEAVVEEEEASLLSPPPAAKPKAGKMTKKQAAAEKEEDGTDVVGGGKRIVVEACTQCQQFKKRALKVKEDLEGAVPVVSVKINPEKPRRGCLEIREEGGEVFISLLNMPRPFTAMKKLDMDEVIKDIVTKIT